MKQNIQKVCTAVDPKKRTFSQNTPKREPHSRLWFLSKGCKQVPPDLIGGKILWAHPDGYFLSAYGQKIKHNFSPASQRGWTAARPSSGGHRGGCYPIMRHFGNKLCHHLMYEAFYGPRTNGMEIDHLNGNKLDYRPANLELVTRAENNRRRSYLHILESVFTVVHHWQTLTPEDYKRFYAMPLVEFRAMWPKPKPALDPDDYDLLHRQKEIL